MSINVEFVFIVRIVDFMAISVVLPVLLPSSPCDELIHFPLYTLKLKGTIHIFLYFIICHILANSSEVFNPFSTKACAVQAASPARHLFLFELKLNGCSAQLWISPKVHNQRSNRFPTRLHQNFAITAFWATITAFVSKHFIKNLPDGLPHLLAHCVKYNFRKVEDLIHIVP